MKTYPAYTAREEVLNSATHGIGFGLGIAALVILVLASIRQHDAWKIVSTSLFGASIITAYFTSTLYHSIPIVSIKRFLKTLDHTSIFLLIAGTYTPFCLVTLRGDWGWTLFGIVWGLAFAGVLFKLFFLYRFHFISMLIYLCMGWVVVIAIVPLMHTLPTHGLLWLALGGLCYTGGILFYAWKSMKYTHAIWHLFVIAGTVCHFFAILWYVIM
ncbi:MAG: hemolysin III family protein [Pseudomonadota bacterium]|nr:hemolysin III family protein [Gammaproteobacteria bacterium]MBU1629374.1 hemolysin III family protein [Gammaproteobacteria bacterium]MBU2545961.1 hemolysin III family protein [Gammaproteobacteria bacterium]